ncbi:T9SS type A sorting domain-containing protein [uncultured Aquimarina sp.]|uniref:T9SS type A sorting domain-containing protein n=1 Tax=uncultured Aquimarina sp. TaxID=575652 RepID=UPI00260E91A7|nr:T9SS type A sorting domain-containing protein [uncultured Aquimarina sp.]
MIKTLFSFLLCLCSIYSITAQYSISYDSTDPVTVVAGQSITLNYTYTASMQVGAQFQIFETDDAGIFGGTTATGTAAAEFPTLDAGTDIMGTITLNIPANFPLSSSLSGTEYRIFGKLGSAANSDATEDADWRIGGTEYPIIIVTSPPYSITYDSANPVSVEAGESITLNYTYSASMDVATQFQIFEADVPGIFGGTTANGTGVLVTPTVTAGTDVATTVTLDIPSDFPASSSLSGTKYYIFGKLSSAENSDASSDADWSVAGEYPEITVSSTLSINDFTAFDRDKLYFNNTSTSLVINDTNEIKSLSIYNIIGKKVFELEDVKNTTNVDLSSLPKGLYIARSDSKFLKFIR